MFHFRRNLKEKAILMTLLLPMKTDEGQELNLQGQRVKVNNCYVIIGF
jgi:hypothetical protein